MGVARTLSRRGSARAPQHPPTNTLASVEPPSPCAAAPKGGSEYGRVGCGLSLFGGFLAASTQGYQGALLPWPATADLARVPRIQVFCPHGWAPGRGARPLPRYDGSAPKRYGGGAGLGACLPGTAWD